MPQPEHRPPFQIAGEIGSMRVWEILEAGISLKIACDACGHESLWTKRYMERKLARWKGATLIRVAYKLRCAGCRSEYIRIWRQTWEPPPSATTSNSASPRKPTGSS